MTIRRLLQHEGWGFCMRGMQRNLVAVAAPIGMTIFLTDAITQAMETPSDSTSRSGGGGGVAR